MIKIPNQPVNFETDPFENPWIAEAKYKQLVNQGDVTQFQLMTTTQENSENLLTNPSWDVSTDGWTVSGSGITVEDYGLSYIQSTSKTATIIRQNGALTIGSFYYIEISIKTAQNGYVKIECGDNHIANKVSGTHIIYGECTTNDAFQLTLIPFANHLATEIVLEYAIVYDTPLANHRFIIEDMDGGFVAEIPAIASYLTAPFAPDTDIAQFIGSYLTMDIDWQTQGIANGCYRIGVCDGDFSTNAQCGVINSEFQANTGVGYAQTFTSPTSSFGWDITLGGTMTLKNYKTYVQFESFGVQTGVLTQSSVLLSGVVYDYSIQIQGSAGEDIDVFCGTQTNAHTATGAIETFTGQLTSDGTDLKLNFDASATGKSMSIYHFRIEATNTSCVPDYYSNPFELATDHDRTVVVNASNSNNAFEMEFNETIWSPRLRMKGYLAPSDNPYINERESLTTSSGNRKNYYLKRRKSKVLVVDQEPEFIHDWLSLLAGFDHMYVDNNEYFVDDDSYNPIVWDKFRIKGSTEINISTKVQQIQKTREIAERNGQTIADNVDGTTVGILGQFDPSGSALQSGNLAIKDPSDLTGLTVLTASNSSNEDESPTNGGA